MSSTTQTEPSTAFARFNLGHAVQRGIKAEDVARLVLEAVQQDRFYVLTHDTSRAGVRIRSEDMLAGKQPTAFPIF